MVNYTALIKILNNQIIVPIAVFLHSPSTHIQVETKWHDI